MKQNIDFIATFVLFCFILFLFYFIAHESRSAIKYMLQLKWNKNIYFIADFI